MLRTIGVFSRENGDKILQDDLRTIAETIVEASSSGKMLERREKIEEKNEKEEIGITSGHLGTFYYD